MPLDSLITGRIATFAGESGFGWVEAIGIRDGLIAFAGSQVELETRADPFTERIELGPDEVAIPGITDAHLHLTAAAEARSHVDLSDSPTLEDALVRIGTVHRSSTDPDAWLQGHGWDPDRWGRWPSAADIEAVAPGRRGLFWAHDHHALLASAAALRVGGVDDGTADPPGGIIGRDATGQPDGLLYEAATGLVDDHAPRLGVDDLEGEVVVVAQDLLRLGVVGVHDPGSVMPDPDLAWAYPAYAHLAENGRLPVRVLASVREESLDMALAGGLRSGDVLGSDPAGRARVGWLKCFADGSLGSRTAALLDDLEPEPERPLAPDRRRGIWTTEPSKLAELTERAVRGAIATQIHAIGDAAVRGALDILGPTAGRVPFMPRVEHVQLLHPDDRGRFARLGIAASVQPSHLGSDAAKARRLWGERAERSGYAWRSLIDTGAVVAFGTDAPVEPYDPWPGIALAVRRQDPRWPDGTPEFGRNQAITIDQALRAACIGGPRSANELDRGRLTVGQRADVVVISASAVDDTVEPGGALATTRPTLVLVDGRVVFEA